MRMGGSERTWGSKGRGTRFLEGHLVITPLGFVPIRLPSSCASLIGFSPSFAVTVTLLLLRATISVFAFAEALAIFHAHLRSPRPPFLPPLFFSHANSNFEGNACVFPNKALSPGLTLAPPFIGISKPPLPLFHPSSNTFPSRSLSLFLPGPSRITCLSLFWNPQSPFSISGTAPGDPPTT